MDLTQLSIGNLKQLQADNNDKIKEIKQFVNDGIVQAGLTEKDIDLKQSDINTLHKQNQDIDGIISSRESVNNTNIKESGKQMNKTELLAGYIEKVVETKQNVISDDIKQEFITTQDNKIIIPESLKFEQDQEEVVDLRKYVNVVGVPTSSGTVVTSSRDRQGLQTKNEDGEFGVLKGLMNEEKEYTTTAKGGVFTLSHEIIKDAGFNITKFIEKELQDEKKVTYNADILTEFNKLNEVAIGDLDTLKSTLIKGIPAKYGKTLVLTISAFEQVALMKYTDGRYVFSNHPTEKDSYLIFGVQVDVVEDEVFGETGDAIGYLISNKAVDLYDYESFSLSFVDNPSLGSKFAVYMRYGTDLVNEDAGLKLTFGLDDTTTPVEP